MACIKLKNIFFYKKFVLLGNNILEIG